MKNLRHSNDSPKFSNPSPGLLLGYEAGRKIPQLHLFEKLGSRKLNRKVPKQIRMRRTKSVSETGDYKQARNHLSRAFSIFSKLVLTRGKKSREGRDSPTSQPKPEKEFVIPTNGRNPHEACVARAPPPAWSWC
jgi:hypothetical protein